jgi:hypothetical protein
VLCAVRQEGKRGEEWAKRGDELAVAWLGEVPLGLKEFVSNTKIPARWEREKLLLKCHNRDQSRSFRTWPDGLHR